MDAPEEEETGYAIRPNKTQIKRDIAVLHDLAECLTQLAAVQLERLQLPGNLYNAIRTAADMPLKGARKRQLKFITGLLRKIDVEPIKAGLAKLTRQSAHAAREHHQIEQWRDKLLAEGDSALGCLLQDYPQADRQQLRQLLRRAKKEAEADKPLQSARAIYQYLKELFSSNT